MTAKQFLSQAIRLDLQISAGMQEACRLRSLAEQVTVVLSPDQMRRGKTPSLEAAAVQLVQLEEDIVRDIQRLVRAKREIREAIARLPRAEERVLLQLRYLCGKKWESIAVEMNYSWRQVHNIHNRALKNIAHYCTLNRAIL